MFQKGFIPLLPLIFIGILLLGAGVYFSKNIQSFKPTASPDPVVPSLSPSPSASASATPSPTPSPTPKPSLKPSPSAAAAPAAPVVSGPPGAGYSTVTVNTEKGSFTANVLMVDLNSSRMITDTGNDSECADNCVTMALKDYVNRNGGYAGVNGSYFCPDTYPDCASKKNSYDFPVYNTRLSRWINQGNMGWNSRAIFYTDGSGAHYLQGANGFSGGLTAGIVNYPGLLSGGSVQIDDNQSGLSDKQRAKGFKVGIGLSDSKHVMVVTANNVNMQEFAYVFKGLGATGALNLDTGGSTALYYNGSYLAGPGRGLPNAIIFAR